jgi:orotidine-5'-phosphate decarboxylase
MSDATKPELIVALDLPSLEPLQTLVESLPRQINYFKVGLELFTAQGPEVLDYLQSKGKHVFLDLKLHDIPRTVARAVAAAARHKVALLTVHAGGGTQMLKAAAEAAGEFGTDAPVLVAVTVLTSLDNNDLQELGVTRSLPSHAAALGEMAISAGIDGLVCSVHEAPAFRKQLGPDPILVTPGIRLPSGDAGDQKRIATPEMAVKAGSSFLVVGRPIAAAHDPHAAALEILDHMNL